MPRPARVVLIGFMGSGKSIVGRLLAARMGWQFADTDAVVVEREGASIARIFEAKGEPGFREAEARALRELAPRRNIVVATGGGAPAQPGNAWFFTTSDEAEVAVFHLRVSLASVRERTHGDRGRPLLARGEAEVKKLYEGRLPLYERLGEGIETDNRSPESIAEDITRRLDSPTRRRFAGDSA